MFHAAIAGSTFVLFDELGLPTFTLPLLPDGIDLGSLYELALLLRAEGVR